MGATLGDVAKIVAKQRDLPLVSASSLGQEIQHTPSKGAELRRGNHDNWKKRATIRTRLGLICGPNLPPR